MTEPFDIFATTPDPALEEVAGTLLRADPRGECWAKVIRHTYDMIYNGQETMRYRWGQLMKTEKTHFGTLFEINAQRQFLFDGGDTTDYRISGHQVDAKWSQKLGGWMLPPEVFGELALVATGNDEKAVWSLGLIRVTQDVRREGGNRDKKSQLNEYGRQSVRWLWRDEPLRPNVLLQLAPRDVDEIFNAGAGTKRTDELFRKAEGMIVHRNAVATVSAQLDAQKRVRYNGGSRSSLQSEGYLILSGVYHRREAAELGLPVPLLDEYVSARMVPSDTAEGILFNDGRWRCARPDEKVIEPAPHLENLVKVS